MNTKDLSAIGLPLECHPLAFEVVRSQHAAGNTDANAILAQIREVAQRPEAYLGDAVYGALAQAVQTAQQRAQADAELWERNPHGRPTGYAQWGNDIDDKSKEQMNMACQLPIAVGGALMPDAHVGYGLPIGGVLATHDAIVPYAVGVDIACRMKLSVLDIPAKRLDNVFSPQVDPFIRALTGGTVFGVGGEQKAQVWHPVMDADWNITPLIQSLKTKAYRQLGTSGSGNHFVEFGILTLEKPALGLEPGSYVALLSHSGSRGSGAMICQTYSELAKKKLPSRYAQFANLAWLPMSTSEGQEYWQAMNLMGEYASANHAVIHQRVTALLGAEIIAGVENHHNFAWKEVHDGKEVYVHRKGATPAGTGVLGVIPGNMADPAFVVVGKGKRESWSSAAHGAGRRISRTQAIKTFDWASWKGNLRSRGVRVLSAGLDEVPGVYKNIHEVMAAQSDLVDIVARFDPKIVRMSDDGKAED